MKFIQIWNDNRKLAIKVFIGVWILWELIVTITAFALPKAYLSIADVKVEPSNPNTSREVLASEALTIISPAILNKVISDLNLNEQWGKRYFDGETLSSDDSRHILVNDIKVTPAKNSSVISILSYSGSPEEAADIANALAKAYVETKTMAQTKASVSPIVSVQLINPAQPNYRPCKPNIPLCMGVGAIVSTGYGTIAAMLVISVRLFFKKMLVQKITGSNNDNSPMLPIVSKY